MLLAVSDRQSLLRIMTRSLAASALALLLALASIGTAQAEHESIAPGAATLAAAVAAAAAAAGPQGCSGPSEYREAGAASWYGKRFQGLPTASGAPFDMYAMTAAHRSLPLGSRIRVTNRSSGKAVLLTVNDRGPFIDGRVLDVSYAAARELGFVQKGLAKVRVETLTC
jgi:rare lipoprotein A